jgi:ParB-like chromosome segregation protein Spo0J
MGGQACRAAHASLHANGRTRPLAALRPSPNNARQHSRKQVAQIVASMRRFGFTNPMLVSDDNGIMAGHGRLLAAKELGLKTVPTVRLSHLSAEERRAYLLLDNKLALNAGWDAEVLGGRAAGAA